MDADATWIDIETAPPDAPGIVRRRVLPASPRNLFLGVVYPSRRRMLILAVDGKALSDLRELPASPAVRTTAVDIGGGKTELRVELDAPEAVHVFAPFVNDVASCASAAPDDGGAVAALIERFGYWRRLLSGELAEGLGSEGAQGLWGELWVMRHVLHAVWGDEVVAAWTGADRDDNDFREGSSAVEVKTTRGDRPAIVRIASERQLDNAPGVRLFLVALAVDPHRQGAGESLPDMVDACRDLISGAHAGDLKDRLLAWGYSETHRQRYVDTRYTLRSATAYEVRPGFPRIIESDLLDGVGTVSYRLSLDACDQFQVDLPVELPSYLSRS